MKKIEYYMSGEDLTDQEYLFQWAELGAKAYCKPAAYTEVVKSLKRARERLADIVKGHVEKGAKE